MTPPTINPSHRFAVYQYTDRVEDPYYIGKRFISANQKAGDPLPDTLIIVATADTTEECQKHIPSSPLDLLGWWLHQDAQVDGALSRMLEGTEL